MSLPNHLLLQHLYTGLNKEDAHYLDVTTGGSFSHKTLAEGKEILDKIMERTSFICKCEPPRVESEVHHEEALVAENESTDIQPLDSTPKSSPDPEPETPKEEDPLPLEFLHSFKEDLFEDFGNTSNYLCQKRSPILITLFEPYEKKFFRETIKELTTLLSD
jgi:hypothetical protein